MADGEEELLGFGPSGSDSPSKVAPARVAQTRPSQVWIEMNSFVPDKPLDLRSSDQLYPAESIEAQEWLKTGRMSNGKIVDAIIWYRLPDDMEKFNEYKAIAHEPEARKDSDLLNDMKERWYYEAQLTKIKLRDLVAQNEQKLASDSMSEEARAQLQKQVRLQKHYLEFGCLEIEHELSKDGKIVFIKVHAPVKTLCAKAEAMELVVPLLPTSTTYSKNRKSIFREQMERVLGVFARAYAWWEAKAEDIVEEEDFFSAAFKFSQIQSFRHGESEDDWENIFSPAQRTLLVHTILEETRYSKLAPDKSNIHKTGISRLVKKGTYDGAYALHDGRHSREKSEAHGPDGERTQLYESWAKFRNWWKPQPLQRVRQYFGEKTAYYFAFIGFYTMALIVPGLAGLIIFISGVATFHDQTDAQELCDSNITMCGICSTCDKWQLSDACTTYKVGYIFDNVATVVFALFMAFWGTLFFEFWKRLENRMAYDWDVMAYHETEPQRPQFKSTTLRPHPVTGRLQRHESKWTRYRRYAASLFTILLMLTLVIFSVIGIIIFRLAVQNALFESTSGSTQKASGAITSILAALLSLTMIIFWGLVYKKVATLLTDWENHETQSSYDHQLSLKIFLFQFVNFYSTLFYIAFFKGQFTGVPGDYNRIFGLRQDDCPEYGCLFELTIQLAVIMVGKQWMNNAQEVFIPQIMGWLKRRKALLGAKTEVEDEEVYFTPWERQSHMTPFPPLGNFAEYLEMIIQYGFVTLFVAAFPLAPLFALLNNIMEIRVDAKKLVREQQRPFGERAEGIGIWLPVLRGISLAAVVTNGFVIGFTSSFIPKLVYEDRFGSLVGYINTSYPESVAKLAEGAGENEVDCHYRGFRDSNGDYTTLHYEIMMARFAFVIVFEHFVFFVKFVLALAISDVPEDIKLNIQREEYQAKVALHQALYGDGDEEDLADLRIISEQPLLEE